jgi:YVTN family beta-propeller protein
MKIHKNILVLFVILCFSSSIAYEPGDYLSPLDLISDNDGKVLYIAQYTANKISVFDIKTNKVAYDISLPAAPSGMTLSSDKKTLFVTGGVEDGQVFVIDLSNKKIKSQISTGHSPSSPVCTSNDKVLYVNNQFDDDVSVIDLSSNKVIQRIQVLREPISSILSHDDKILFVANHLPTGPADQYSIASSVSVINTATNEVVNNIQLPNGSNAIKDLAISPDNKYIYATHILARYQMPTTQLERGWMNTNAMSIIDVDLKSYLNTVLLDEIDLGAANPWGVACSDDGKLICVSHAGSHEISVIDRDELHSKLAQVDDGLEVAGRIFKPEDVKNDLAFLDGFRRRVKLSGLGPRGIALVGNKLYAAEYFTESIGALDITNALNPRVSSIPLGKTKPMSTVRKGELLFHDARQCFQQWQSCSSCHPGEARSDALNWDLLNDGVGNPKNSKSLLLAHKTPPAMISGVRDKAESAVRAGFKYIQFAEVPDEDASAIDQYLDSLEPLTSPHLVNNKLSESAKRGESLFASAKCIDCHSGTLFTDQQQYVVGTGKGREKEVKFDTPTIIENWRTAPFLHDGRAATIEEVLTKFNPEDKHGITSTLTDKQIDDLVAYVLSQ